MGGGVRWWDVDGKRGGVVVGCRKEEGEEGEVGWGVDGKRGGSGGV